MSILIVIVITFSNILAYLNQANVIIYSYLMLNNYLNIFEVVFVD